MFERFSAQSREVVILAQRVARYSGSPGIGGEHLLLGLLGPDQDPNQNPNPNQNPDPNRELEPEPEPEPPQATTPAAQALRDLGVRPESRARLARTVHHRLGRRPRRRRPRRDRHRPGGGPPALSTPGSAPAPSTPNAKPITEGHLPFSPLAKKTMALALARGAATCGTTRSPRSTSCSACCAPTTA